jgi:acetyl esterase/lipase
MPHVSRRELLKAGGIVAAAGSAVPSLVCATGSGRSIARVAPASLVDPELLPPLESFLKSGGDDVLSAKNLDQARKLWVTSSAAPALVYEDRSIPGLKGAPEVHVIVINAATSKSKRPAILHIHGGGFVAGTAAQGVSRLQQLAHDHDCVIVTVNYRLAPETRFPGSLEDIYAALKWLHHSAESLGADPSRIVLMGESSGGGHAAMLAIAARDRGEVPIAFQLLIYPMLDDRTGSSRHVPPHIGAYVWVPAENRFAWSSFLGVPAGSRTVPAGAVPARVENLGGLPPAFVGVGSLDLFVDEDIDYARRLISSGVSTELFVVPGAYHGFDIIAPEASPSRAFRATWTAALARALERPAGS